MMQPAKMGMATMTGRQRGSTRCQMQKLAVEKFHDDPFTAAPMARSNRSQPSGRNSTSAVLLERLR
jgi:hypothetical protein